MTRWLALTAALLVAAAPACAGDKNVAGEIKVDGSSTVYLITEAMATQFKQLHPRVNITVGISGTGGGFKKFAAGEIDISDASRKIKDAEAQKCKDNGIAFTELQVAWDGLAVILHKDNTWATKMTLDQLKKIWHPDTGDFKHAKTWRDVDPSWPNEEIQLYGAGPDSGTFDYFTEAVNGKEKLIRTDYRASEDDNNTVQGVARNKYAIGFLGVAYYEVNKGTLTAAALADKKGNHVLPEAKTVLSRQYPLSRPLYIYVKDGSLKRPEVAEFTKFYLRRSDLVSAAKYVPLSALQQRLEQKKLEKALAQ